MGAIETLRNINKTKKDWLVVSEVFLLLHFILLLNYTYMPYSPPCCGWLVSSAQSRAYTMAGLLPLPPFIPLSIQNKYK
jgi:hypothetical protein